MATVRDLMTPQPVSCRASDPLTRVAELMLEADTGFMPVLEGDALVGVLTDRDLVVRALARGFDPARTTAFEVCSQPVKWVSPDASLDTARARMEQKRIRRLAVLEGGLLVGVVSLGDLAEFAPEAAEDVLVEVSRSPSTLAHRPPGA